MEKSNNRPFYPKLIYGWNPWETYSTTSKIPGVISAVGSIEVKSSIDLHAEGVYNTAFDIWITDSIIPTVDNRVAEILIWINGTEVVGAPLIETVEIGDFKYEFHRAQYDIPYLAFIQIEKEWNGSIDLYPFIKYLIVNNHISSENYLASIEFGNEIWSGEGEMILSGYDRSVQ